MSKTLKLVSAAFFAAVGVVLPLAFHTIPGAGGIFLPMHIPVLLCGFVCGPFYGALCGVVAPAVSYLLTGMPPAATLPGMLFELAAYGAVSGLLFHTLPVKRFLVRTYTSLIIAMLAGRAVSGILNALIFKLGAYSLRIWLTSSFVTALPGIAIQLVIIPAVLLLIRKTDIIGRFSLDR